MAVAMIAAGLLVLGGNALAAPGRGDDDKCQDGHGSSDRSTKCAGKKEKEHPGGGGEGEPTAVDQLLATVAGLVPSGAPVPSDLPTPGELPVPSALPTPGDLPTEAPFPLPTETPDLGAIVDQVTALVDTLAGLVPSALPTPSEIPVPSAPPTPGELPVPTEAPFPLPTETPDVQGLVDILTGFGESLVGLVPTETPSVGA